MCHSEFQLFSFFYCAHILLLFTLSLVLTLEYISLRVVVVLKFCLLYYSYEGYFYAMFDFRGLWRVFGPFYFSFYGSWIKTTVYTCILTTALVNDKISFFRGLFPKTFSIGNFSLNFLFTDGQFTYENSFPLIFPSRNFFNARTFTPLGFSLVEFSLPGLILRLYSRDFLQTTNVREVFDPEVCSQSIFLMFAT